MSIFKGLSVEDNLLSIIETKEFDNHKDIKFEDLLVEFNITNKILVLPCLEEKDEELKLPDV